MSEYEGQAIQSEPEQEQQVDVRYAGFWLRVGAVLIDTLILMLIFVPLMLLIFGVEYYTVPESREAFNLTETLLQNVLPAAVTVLLWVRFAGTPGKLILGLAVVDNTTFGNISVMQAIIRYLGYIPSVFVLMIGLLWVAFDKRKRGWHDLLAGTVVIRR
ncbi:RDD family protein [Neiella marina]|uniref:RDD family protein n=1 Tax=Neiella holothuriorum TaxID=2870530 RepID=A0ABS7EED4_9GAMM|nr:RDD family protein [Neiella holothuriorum]MBW8190681.1 RDD family protein [Neiella holothuriorum]